MVTQLNPNLDFSMTLPPQINLLVNGGFEIWQRGAGPFTGLPIAAYTADKWGVNYGGAPTFSVSREGSIVHSESYSLKLNVTVVGSGTSVAIYQNIENAQSYRGKIVTVSVAMKCNTPNAAQIYLGDGFSTWLSPYHTGDNTWQILTVTALVSIAATSFRVTFGLPTSCQVSTTYIDSAMMTVSPGPINFIPMHPADDLARCLRYFENDDSGLQITWYSNPAETNRLIFHFSVQKSAIPSMTFVNGTLSQATASSTGSVSTKGFTLALNSDGTAGLVRRINGTLNDAAWSAAVT